MWLYQITACILLPLSLEPSGLLQRKSVGVPGPTPLTEAHVGWDCHLQIVSGCAGLALGFNGSTDEAEMVVSFLK